jgi:hypothetical protein
LNLQRLVPAVALIVLSACGPETSAPSSATPSHAVVVVSAVSPTSQTVTKTLCKLPVGIGRGTSGFVDYPGGSFAPDQSSDLSSSPYHGSNATSVGGLGVPSYDWSARRWLPVRPAMISPDGASYAYSEMIFPPAGPTPQNGPGPGPTGSKVHVVSVGAAADRVLLDSRSLWEAVAYTGRQIYLIKPCFEGCGADSGGLWTLDASTGKIDELVAPDAPVPFNPSVGLSQHIWAVIGSDAAWTTDPHGGLARLDLASKAVSVWFTVQGKFLRPIGLDARGFPIAEGEADYSVAGSSRGGAWLVTASQQALRLAPDSTMIDDAVADSYGTWLLTFDKIYRWEGGQLTQIAVLPQGDRGLAGHCQ